MKNKATAALVWFVQAMKETHTERHLTEKEVTDLFEAIDELNARGASWSTEQ